MVACMVHDQYAVSVPVTTLWRDPSAVRDVDKPAIIDEPDPRAWPAALDSDQRRDLQGRVDSQLLLGEPVEIVDEAAEWVKVVAPWQPSSLDARGYPGWMPRAHVKPLSLPTGREFVVTVDSAPLHHDDSDERPREATFATVLPVLDESADRVLVALPGGGQARISGSSGVVRATPDHRAAVPVDPADAMSIARRFTGLQYLWAGMSAYGLDCSGIVHISYRALGRVIPRDALDQADAGLQAPRSQARPGDLYFFSRTATKIDHVGFVVGEDDRVLHAPGTGNGVVDEPMPDDRRPGLLPFVARLTTPT